MASSTRKIPGASREFARLVRTPEELAPWIAGDFILRGMVKLGIPLTRENYLSGCGLPDPPDAEHDIPPPFMPGWPEDYEG